ncbi:putative RNA-directed DNA polymerase from transposon X-element [Araneus ventricosus]|uniref:Putative RNA-directed DNA polymerase from transposon X-element n=1 Tax=Araneus ventricosus TaxID=182803 RepID=A0A4Y2RR68_ARAVE|nr:putative RNA-directed DNA polymerase from transposon X-element [Araneus ventricosus]
MGGQPKNFGKLSAGNSVAPPWIPIAGPRAPSQSQEFIFDKLRNLIYMGKQALVEFLKKKRQNPRDSAAFRKSVFPSQIPYLINGDPKGSLQEAAQNILDQIFLSPAISTNYNLTTSTQPSDPPFSPQEISAVIEHLPSGKAPGIDGIDNLLIKIIHKRFNNIFPTLFNKCLHLSCFPDSLKIGNIISFQKRGKDQRLASSYRPISLLPTIGKVLEELMTQRLTYHLESTNSLNDRQHGFREGKSVDTAINELLRNIKTRRRDGKHVLVLSIDIKGAFDNLQHRAILKTLDASACPSNINRLFHSLL